MAYKPLGYKHKSIQYVGEYINPIRQKVKLLVLYYYNRTLASVKSD